MKRVHLVPIVCILFLFGILLGVHYIHQSNTILGVTFIKYTAPQNMYSFSYPNTWKKSSQDQSSVTQMAYTVNGTQYLLTVSPPGQITPQASNLTFTSTTVTYNGQTYSRTVWSADGAPLYITAIPQTQSQTYYELGMQLPAQNTQHYLTIFDHIVGSLNY